MLERNINTARKKNTASDLKPGSHVKYQEKHLDISYNKNIFKLSTNLTKEYDNN